MVRYMITTIAVVVPAAILVGFLIYGSFDSWQAIRRSKIQTEQTEKPSRFIQIIEPGCTGLSYTEKTYPGYSDYFGVKPKRLAYHEDIDKLNEKFDLLLTHLKLEYVPEKDKKEFAHYIKIK